jgi:hypothetical protein
LLSSLAYGPIRSAPRATTTRENPFAGSGHCTSVEALVKAYRVKTDRRIAPFGDPARDLFIGVRTLADWQAESVRGAGLELADVDTIEAARDRPCLLFFDDVFFSEMALRQFLADTLRESEDCQLAIEESPLLRALEPLQGARAIDGGAAFGVFHLAKGGDLEQAKRAASAASEGGSEGFARAGPAGQAKPVFVRRREKEIELRLPPLVGDGEGRVTQKRTTAPLTARIVAHVRHWFHVLRLSQLSIGIEIVERLRKQPRMLLRLRMMKGRDPWELARKINFVDETARVHPTADLECAVIGPGAVVQAHAHVHRSVVGANVEISDHAAVVGCTLAERVQVLRASYLALCAAMPGGTLSNYKAQLSLFGRDVFLTTSALLLDAKLEGDVSVEHEGSLASLGTPFFGSCLGHRVTLGANVTVLPGRAIPNGQTVVGGVDQIVASAPDYPEGMLLTVRNGRIVPL